MERDGSISAYRVAYVIGSGNHASGYMVRIGDHLFQSPLCYYPRLKRYDMAPGYEEYRAPDFIRAVTEGCLDCHSGKPRHIDGTLNEYGNPAFAEEAHFLRPLSWRSGTSPPAAFAGHDRESCQTSCGRAQQRLRAMSS